MAIENKVYAKLISEAESAREKAKGQADEIVARVASEDRAMTPDEEKALGELQDKLLAANKRLGNLHAFVKEASEAGESGESRGRGVNIVREVRGNRPVPTQAEHLDPAASKEERERQYSQVFRRWLAVGDQGLSAEERSVMLFKDSDLRALQDGAPSLRDCIGASQIEQRALSALDTVSGGATVPTTMLPRLVQALKDFSGVLQTRATRMDTGSGEAFNMPRVDGTSMEGTMLAEGQDAPDATDPRFGTTVLNAYTFVSGVLPIPRTLIADSLFDIEGLVARMLGESLGRTINKELTNGNGASRPQGIVTATPVTVTAASQTALLDTELIDLELSLDAAYRFNAEFQFGPDIERIARKWKSAEGRPLWQPAATASLANRSPGLINGYPYIVNRDMLGPAAGRKTVIFGDHSAYQVRMAGNIEIRRTQELFFRRNQVGVMALLRMDGALLNAGTNPLVALQQAP